MSKTFDDGGFGSFLPVVIRRDVGWPFFVRISPFRFTLSHGKTIYSFFDTCLEYVLQFMNLNTLFANNRFFFLKFFLKFWLGFPYGKVFEWFWVLKYFDILCC